MTIKKKSLVTGGRTMYLNEPIASHNKNFVMPKHYEQASFVAAGEIEGE